MIALPSRELKLAFNVLKRLLIRLGLIILDNLSSQNQRPSKIPSLKFEVTLELK